MSDRFRRLMMDPSGFVWKRIDIYYSTIFSFFCKGLVKLQCRYRGVTLGSSCRFYGTPIIRRHPISRIKIGSNCTFRSDRKSNLAGVNRKCIIATHRKNARIEIEDRSGFSGTVIGAAGSIRIGSNVICGANTFITDFDWHSIDPISRKDITKSFSKVIIEDNVWIGLNSVILKGVTIGKNSVIGANSLVLSEIPENVVAGGNPCRIIRDINDIRNR